jgi:hypothetical protein
MKRFMFGCLGVTVAAFTLHFAQAEVKAGLFDHCTPCAEVADCNPCDQAACDPCEAVCGSKQSKWFVNGHLESGFWANEYGQKNYYRGSSGSTAGTVIGTRHDFIQESGNTAFLQNVNNTGYQLNQLYLSTGKSVDGSHGLDLGGTVDFVWGTDARFVQSNGLEKANGHDAEGWGTGDYYSAFAQAYFEAEYRKWNVKVGKFYAPFGSQSFKSTDNFFYSFAPTYGIVPATANGAYATYTVNSKLSVYSGWAQPDQWGETKDDNAFFGGAIYQATKKLNLHYAFAYGENHYPAKTNEYDYFVNSLVVKYQISKKLSYVFDWSYFQTKVLGTARSSSIYGFNNELIYTLNSKWAVGLRFGSIRDGGFHSLGFTTGDDDQDWYNVSLGANWTPTKWLTVKSELRYDNVDGRYNAFGQAKAVANGWTDTYVDHQLSGGVSTVIKF